MTRSTISSCSTTPRRPRHSSRGSGGRRRTCSGEFLFDVRELILLQVLERELVAERQRLAVDEENVAAFGIADVEVIAPREQPLFHQVTHPVSSPERARSADAGVRCDSPARMRRRAGAAGRYFLPIRPTPRCTPLLAAPRFSPASQ